MAVEHDEGRPLLCPEEPATMPEAAACRRKDDFLAILAHELRNPLAPIRLALHLLEEPNLDAAAAERARGMILRQVAHLARLVDELLDASHIGRGEIRLVLEPVQLSSVIFWAVEAVAPLVESRGHSLAVRLPPAPVWVEADPARLEQAVVGLLSNAARYTDPGGQIEVVARAEVGQAVLSVSDNGIGIPPDLLPHVFDLFTQADHSLDRGRGGLGIGLTMVRGLVRRHGGEVTGHSGGPGKGSEFVIRLPAIPPPPASPPRPREEAGTRPLRVAVIDDNQDAGESLGTLLRMDGHEVAVYTTGEEALRDYASFRPEVVLLDIGLPGLDGYQVAGRLRRQPGGEGLFLVAVTGYGQEEDRRRAAAAGFSHHLVKPANPAELRRLLRERARAVG
jgi:two-component system CheB/CheR fusion protein